ncbi:HEAT repeat domain-containing protein [Streptomyces syringium]|uniref:HEAT repeat domain-containing protein n=1 Tax=Streptomyces syringium TaxID=76729 RepID=UPI0036505FFB
MNKQDEPARKAVDAARRGSAASLEGVLDPGDAEHWIALDLGIRRQSSSWPWSDTLPSMAWVRAGEPPANKPSLAVALCHPDGRIRQAALVHGAAVPALLPLVAVRCADWVVPVRARARELLRAALAEPDPVTLATVTAVVLRTARRRQGEWARELVVERLRRADDELTDALLGSRDRATRRLAHRIAIGRDRFSPATLAHLAATDDDVVVQDLCADAALARTDDGRYDEILRPLLGSRHSRVRAAGVTALGRTGRAEEATEFLADRSEVVRACARWVLRRHGRDPLPHYRKACAGPAVAVLPGAVAGLGECGTRADADLLRPLLTHPSGPVRARAVGALRALGAADPAWLRPLLDDPSASVAREASVALLPYAAELPAAWLWERLAVDRPRHVRSAAHRLLSEHRGTVPLRCHLSLLDDPEPRLRVRARAAVPRWCPADAASAYAALSPVERTRLDTLIDRAEPVLGGPAVDLLRWYLRSGSGEGAAQRT